MTEHNEQTHKAGAFDIRTFIGALMGIYGVILLLVGLFSSDGRTINLVTGICLAAASAFFILWARLRPVRVPDHLDAADMERPPGH
ncbi:MAG: hypothetical protein HOQ22_03560 [Nocardioidaceae bacterium]|nr:hypothetical protein [Nocardioidaceae bacterium]NUS50105.1 hypothetical protein [Nocardioidaceae bacterium]